MAKISVIIPCYNQGQYINETIDSVLNQSFNDFEIIIVNDGSTDLATVSILKGISHPKIKVFHTENQGLSAARNFGVAKSCGNYLLPLDSDDKIGADYLQKGCTILDSNPEVGIVYCQAELFGRRQGVWNLPPFSLPEMLKANIIFATAFYRKSDFDLIGGYDTSLKKGLEDYDFWLSMLELGRTVYCLEETLFYYRKHRVKKSSMIHRLGRANQIMVLNQVQLKHKELYAQHIEDLLAQIKDLKLEVLQLRETTIWQKLAKKIKKLYR